MRLFAFVGLLAVATGSWAQEPSPIPQASEQSAQEQATAPMPAQKQTIVLPAGTRVSLTLTNPIRSRAARKGDAIRAVTSFPVTVGTLVAIPSGTYLEGVIGKITKGGPSGHAGLEVHFTRMVFSNGYNVALDGATAQAKAGNPNATLPGTQASGAQSYSSGATAFQQFSQPPPPPKLGPSVGLITGIGVGVTAAATVGLILLGRHRAGDVIFDAGYQFDMVLGNPLTLDADSVAAALNGPNAL
jgi:hypothetical protein